MNKLLTSAAFAIVLSAPAYASTFAQTTGYALNANGTEIAILGDVTDTGTTQTLNLSGGRIDAITYRPFTQELLGYRAGTNGAADQIYSIDVSTGALTDLTPTFGSGVGVQAGGVIDFDFNTSLDATRIVSTMEDNLVFFPSNTGSGNANAGGVIRATDLFYAPGDANEGANPSIFANAYTNAVDGELSPSTQQYALDSDTNSLVTLANNAGTLATIATLTNGGLALDFTNMGSLEIVSTAQDQNVGFALLNFDGSNSGLYTVDLTTGETVLLGDLGSAAFTSFAAQLAPAPVPLPAAGLLMLFGLGALGATRARRKKS